MLQVWKYPLNKGMVDYELDLPRRTQILTLQLQYDIPTIWALVDPKETIIYKRHFKLVGTGHDIDHEREGLDYIGTVQFAGGSLIYHLFEVFQKGGT